MAKKAVTCSICSGSNRTAIDKALAKGETLRTIATRFGPSPSTLCRHRRHVAHAIELAEVKRHVSVGDSLLNDMERIRIKLWRMCEEAEQQRDRAAQIVVLRELRATIESLDEKFSRVRGAATREVVLKVVYDEI
jgi:hypothetical protein